MKGLVKGAISVFDEVILYSKNEKNRLFAASRVLEIEGYAANNRRTMGGAVQSPLVIAISNVPWAPQQQVTIMQPQHAPALPASLEIDDETKQS